MCPAMQWTRVTAMVADDLALAGKGYQSDRSLCKRVLVNCKQKFESVAALAKAINFVNEENEDADDGPLVFVNVSEMDLDPTVLFVRFGYCPHFEVWDSIFGRVVLPPDTAFCIGDVRVSLRSLTRISPCCGRYKV